VEIRYDIFTQQGELYESVRVSGQDEEECQEQLDLSLDKAELLRPGRRGVVGKFIEVKVPDP
jgi:hypothetical protein